MVLARRDDGGSSRLLTGRRAANGTAGHLARVWGVAAAPSAASPFVALDSYRGGRPATIAVILVLGVAFSWFTETAGVHAIFDAFLAGAILPRGIPAVGYAIRVATGTVLLALPLSVFG